LSFTQKWKKYKTLVEQTGTAQRMFQDQRKRNEKMYKSMGNRFKETGDPYTEKAPPTGVSAPPLGEEIDKETINSFEVKDGLDPQIWESDDKIRGEIRDQLLQIAQDFIDNLDFDVTVENITLTGSLANYNWSKYSDLDLHILVDFDLLDANREIVSQLFRAIRMLWNQKHDIHLKDYEVEMYVQDSKEKHISTGIYSLTDDKWDIKPFPEDARINRSDIKKKAEDIQDRISHIEDLYGDTNFKEAIKQGQALKEKLSKMRRCGLEQGGQYSVENLTFKVMRRSEEIGRLHKIMSDAYDEMMSIEQ